MSVELIDWLRERYDIDTDAALADKCKISRPTFSMVRAGTRRITGDHILAFNRYLGASVKQMQDILKDKK